MVMPARQVHSLRAVFSDYFQSFGWEIPPTRVKQGSVSESSVVVDADSILILGLPAALNMMCHVDLQVVLGCGNLGTGECGENQSE